MTKPVQPILEIPAAPVTKREKVEKYSYGLALGIYVSSHTLQKLFEKEVFKAAFGERAKKLWESCLRFCYCVEGEEMDIMKAQLHLISYHSEYDGVTRLLRLLIDRKEGKDARWNLSQDLLKPGYDYTQFDPTEADFINVYGEDSDEWHLFVDLGQDFGRWGANIWEGGSISYVLLAEYLLNKSENPL